MGNFETHSAGDPASALGGVIVLHPWWGLNADVIAYADRLSAEGFAVAAPDMFGGQIATTQEDAKKLAQGADEQQVNEIVAEAADRLSKSMGSGKSMAALGFSFGAHWAIWLPAQRADIVGSVLYYGTTGDNLDAAQTPVQGHFAEDDPFETADWVAEFEQTLRTAGREVTLYTYPGTGHWFAEPSRDAYREDAANLAFDRTVAFLKDKIAV